MEEVLIRLERKQWENMKRGLKSIVICESVPESLLLPFRAFVYVEGRGVVGWFDCDGWRKTIDAPSLAPGSGFSKSQLIMKAAGKPLCGWHVEEESAFSFGTPRDLRYLGFLSDPPNSWAYIGKVDL